MEKQILKWALENTDAPAPSDERKEESSAEKFAFLSAALGPSDAVKMRECVCCITDKQDTTENKLIALDNLELLVESIDNACDVEKLDLWSPLLGVLDDQELTCGILWVVGTASQNNKTVQDLLVEKYGILSRIVRLLHFSPTVSKKALYAISSLLCENANSRQRFKELNGLHHLQTCSGSDILEDRINFLIGRCSINRNEMGPCGS